MGRVAIGPLEVSRLCLGAMLMGERTPKDEAFRILDAFLDAGGNFVDTADVYSDGGSERLLGEWGRRDEVVLATKVRFEVSDPPGDGLGAERIRAACDASLRRLRTDVIDLYQLHAPDPDVPLHETLEALDSLVAAGKVRALGVSNFPGWLLARALDIQEREGWARFVSLQPQLSLIERGAELELLPLCRAAGLAVMPWGPLGQGFLTGRYDPDAPPPEGSRIATAPADLEEAWERRNLARNHEAVRVARDVARARGATVPQVALAWLLSTPGLTVTPVIGPRTLEQLEGLLPSVELGLGDEERARLGAPTAPPPLYPYRFLSEQMGVDDLGRAYQ